MISEKEMMIVDAVNASKCEPKTIGLNRADTHISIAEEDNSIYIEGDVHFTSGTAIAGYWKVICTIGEYNKCIDEMSEGAFVPDAKPAFVYGQDVYLKDGAWESKELKFGCLNLNGNGAILLHECGYAYAKLDNVSSKPVKTKEDIELEEAKKKQVDDNVMLYSHHFETVKQATYLFEHMQKGGRLAEILLPLESK